MNFSRISEWAIKNPVPTILMFVVLTLAGVTGYLGMRINNNPDVDFPLVSVTAVRPGAAPDELETQITRYIEDSLSGLEGVRHINSNISDGATNTIIEFEIGTDLEKATNDVRNAVASVRANLPADIPEPTVQRVDVIGGELITYVVRDPSRNTEQLSWFVDNDITRRLLTVRGISQVDRTGGVQREVRVRLDPARLAAYGATVATVSSQLRSINADLPGGRATIGGEERSIRTLGAADNIEDLRNRRINVAGGGTVRLGDLGSVEDQWGEPRGRARYNGEEVVTFGMLRSRAGSEVKIAEQVRPLVQTIIREQRAAGHRDFNIEEVTSNVQYVEDSYTASLEALLLGGALAIAVVFLFLRDWRATLVAGIAMPLSLIPTFAILGLMGQSINGVTLLALSLTIGILVDDAIVEIENIVRHMRGGKKPYPAAIEAADEIGLAVVATTFTIVAVFAPTGFMPGIVGQFFKAFALGTCVSVLFSLLVARTLTPLMGAFLLKSHGHEDRDPFWMAPYLRVLQWSLRFRWVVLGLGFLMFVATILVATRLPTEFFPSGDQARAQLTLELPPGVTLDDTDRAAMQVTRLLRQRPEVMGVYVNVGSAGATGSVGDVRRATFFVNLTPRGERAISQADFERTMAAQMRQIPGVRVRAGGGQGGPGDGSLQVSLSGDNPRTLNEAVRQVQAQMRTIPGLANIVNTSSLPRPEILVTPKLVQAAQAGVTAATLSQTVRVATLGDVDQNLPKFNLGDRQIPIRLTLTEAARDDLATLQNLRVPTSGGGTVPLSSVADIAFGSGPNTLTRRDRSRVATIRAEMNGIALGEANQRVTRLPIMQNLPAGVRQQPAGDVESLQELFSAFITAFITGILLMYAVLVLLFRSFSLPITILTALPLAIGGAFVALFVWGSGISMPSLIGILMLMGIAAKNSILFVDYALEGRKRGMDRREALIDAGHKRARPILMTSVAMGAGMVPIAVGWGADVEFRMPMAQAVIGGLISSTLLSLLYVPVVYTFIDDVKKRVDRLRAKAFANQGRPDERPVHAAPAPTAIPAE